MGLFEPIHDRLEKFAFALTRDRDVAHEVIAETVLIAYEKFDSLRSHEAFLSFLFTIARRTHHKHRAKQARSERLDDLHANSLIDQRMAPDVQADISAVYAALDKLPEKQREAVVLFEILGLSMKEIRVIQGGTLVAVKVRVARGRRRLAAILGVDDVERRPECAGNASEDMLASFTVVRES